MLILEILKAVQIALYALLVAAIVFVILNIAVYAREELEDNATVKALGLWFKSTIEALRIAMMAPEFQPLYSQTALTFDFGPFLDMLQRRVTPSKHRYIPRHVRVVQNNFFEDGFESFVRGFDHNGSLLQKHAAGNVSNGFGAESYLKNMGDLVYPIG